MALVNDFTDYLYSSAFYYEKGIKQYDKLLFVNEVLLWSIMLHSSYRIPGSALFIQSHWLPRGKTPDRRKKWTINLTQVWIKSISQHGKVLLIHTNHFLKKLFSPVYIPWLLPSLDHGSIWNTQNLVAYIIMVQSRFFCQMAMKLASKDQRR